jgi:hypothetical protein
MNAGHGIPYGSVYVLIDHSSGHAKPFSFRINEKIFFFFAFLWLNQGT